jgi:hypothetical protein
LKHTKPLLQKPEENKNDIEYWGIIFFSFQNDHTVKIEEPRCHFQNRQGSTFGIKITILKAPLVDKDLYF